MLERAASKVADSAAFGLAGPDLGVGGGALAAARGAPHAASALARTRNPGPNPDSHHAVARVRHAGPDPDPNPNPDPYPDLRPEQVRDHADHHLRDTHLPGMCIACA
eukprot:scaffold56110_cov64-Phaeocystis_antarctica.AAC.2